jgi:hypothetical protein
MDSEHEYPIYDDPEAVKLMVHFFYHHSYDLGHRTGLTVLSTRVKRSCPPWAEGSDILAHAKMFTIAVKYCVASLQSYACKQVAQALKGNTMEPRLGVVIADVYTATPEDAKELRNVITASPEVQFELLALGLCRTRHQGCSRPGIFSAEGEYPFSRRRCYD